MVGEVEAIGTEVTRFSVGERVSGFDDAGRGGHAEHKTISGRRMIATIPEGIPFEQAAAGTEGAHYALAYVRALRIGEATKVLVHGATGATGAIGSAECSSCDTPEGPSSRRATPRTSSSSGRSAPTSSSIASRWTSRTGRKVGNVVVLVG